MDVVNQKRMDADTGIVHTGADEAQPEGGDNTTTETQKTEETQTSVKEGE